MTKGQYTNTVKLIETRLASIESKLSRAYLNRLDEEVEDAVAGEDRRLEQPIAPLFQEAMELGMSALKVYNFMWDKTDMKSCRRICGTSHWTVKGISGELGMCHKTVTKALYKLLDSGLITIIGETGNKAGSNNTVFGVTHPDWLEHVRYSINMMGQLPSERLKEMRTKAKRPDTSHLPEEWHDDSWLKNHKCKWTEPAVPFTEAQQASINRFLKHQSTTQS